MIPTLANLPNLKQTTISWIKNDFTFLSLASKLQTENYENSCQTTNNYVSEPDRV